MLMFILTKFQIFVIVKSFQEVEIIIIFLNFFKVLLGFFHFINFNFLRYVYQSIGIFRIAL